MRLTLTGNKTALFWKKKNPYVGDSTLNEDHYANWLMKNYRFAGEFYNLPHYKSIFQKGLRKISKKPQTHVCELGAGGGFFSAILSRYAFIEKVYSLEYSKGLTEKVMPKAFQVLKAKQEKIQRVCGSFVEMEFPDEKFRLAIRQ